MSQAVTVAVSSIYGSGEDHTSQIVELVKKNLDRIVDDNFKFITRGDRIFLRNSDSELLVTGYNGNITLELYPPVEHLPNFEKYVREVVSHVNVDYSMTRPR